MKKSQACSPSGARSSNERVGAHLGAQRAEGVQVRVEPAAADHVAAGRRHVGLAEAGQQRAGQQERGADALGQRGVDLGVRRSRRSGRRPRSRRATRRCAPEVHEQLDHRLHVADARDVAQHDLLRGQQRGGERGQRGVLVAGGHERPRQGRPAFDDELLHAWIRPGAGIEPAAKGIEGHLPRRFGPAAGYPAPRGAVTRRGLGSWSTNGSRATRCASTCSASRPACAPTRASGARTRSCGRSPGSSTTSTTSATRTSTPATRARRWSCSSRRATRRS